jgi:hypothetical protein
MPHAETTELAALAQVSEAIALPSAAALGESPPPPPPPDHVGNALSALIKYVPTEVITLYVATVAAREAIEMTIPSFSPMFIYWTFVVITPMLFLLLFLSRLQVEKQPIPPFRAWPLWRMIAATIAFGVWALAIPNNPYIHGPAAAAVSGVGALFVSMVLSLLDPFFE